MRNRLILLTLIMMLIAAPVQMVMAQDVPPVAPDRAQTALNLMAVECQNLNDFAIQAGQGNFNGYDAARSQFETAIGNIDYLIGPFIPDLILEFNNVYQNLTPDSASIQETAGLCQNFRTLTYEKMLQYDGILNPDKDITSFDECVQAGYFVSGDTCFMDGDFVSDKNGSLIGLYNANCFESNDFYQGSCWYCDYGNNENGCKDSTGF